LKKAFIEKAVLKQEKKAVSENAEKKALIEKA
jgi:hypothetical protein